MLKKNLRLIDCVRCGRRGDNIGDKNQINQISSQELVDKVKILPDKIRTATLNDYLCKDVI